MTNWPDRDDRVAIWNSYFKMAWSATRVVFESDGSKAANTFATDPPPLSDDEHGRLAAVLLSTLAIEARANHLIDDLIEQQKLDPLVGKAAKYAPLGG
jgi:hypothetical protein